MYMLSSRLGRDKPRLQKKLWKAGRTGTKFESG
jgi:hypothetical protein